MAAPPALMTTVLSAFGLYKLVRGTPLPPRVLGHDEIPMVETPANDSEQWPFRGAGVSDIQELTRTQVRSTTASQENEFSEQEKHVDVLIIGGAAGGLASAACLKRRGVENVIVIEKNESSGDIWRSRYHRLHLHDIAEECSLPGLPVPDYYPTYIPRDDYAKYLDEYSVLLKLNCKFSTLVKKVEKKNGVFLVTVENLKKPGSFTQIEAKHVVLCNGVYNDPFVPKFEENTFKGLQLHSSRYTNGTELGLKNKNVLVVGFGNSACEIAVDLCEHGAKPTVLAMLPQTILPRSTVQVLQNMVYSHVMPLMSIPFGWVLVLLGVACIDPYVYYVQQQKWGGKQGLKKLDIPLLGYGPVMRAIIDNEPPVMDVGLIALAQQGKLRVKTGALKSLQDNAVTFTDGSSLSDVDCIVWATGYKMIQGHTHIFDGELAQKLGQGLDFVKQKMITPGSEIPDVPGLWFNFGRIQMLRDGATSMSWKIAKQLNKSNPANDAVDAKESWQMFAAKHAAVVAAMYAWRRYKSSKL